MDENIESEILGTLRWKEKKPERSLKAVNRALELLDLTIEALCSHREYGKLKEICRCREVICDYFYGENQYRSTPEALQKYFDIFVSRIPHF